MNQKEFVIRMGNAAEGTALQEACVQAYSGYKHTLLPEDWKQMKSNLQDKPAFAKLLSVAVPFIAVCSGQIAGLVFLVPHGNETPFFSAGWAYIRMLGVLPEYRGLGIAHALMQKCIAHARQSGEKTIALHTAAYQRAWPMYEGLGFQRIKDIGPLYGKTYWLYTLDLNQAVSAK
jgi:ribosomal protein S18 acetylase RimI-like enzyme